MPTNSVDLALADLRERVERAAAELEDVIELAYVHREKVRLNGKLEGIQLMLGYIDEAQRYDAPSGAPKSPASAAESVFAPYAWRIDIDELYDPAHPGVIGDEAGRQGPANADPTLLARLKDDPDEGATFRIYDDDGELYYTGRLLVVAAADLDDWELAPLEDFGTPNAGATEIRYRRPAGNWETI